MVIYAFQCLPFELASAPRVFTKVVKVIFSYIRSMGISSFFYIDDSLLQAENFASAVSNTEKVKHFIESLGFDINLENSVLIPSHRIVILGYIIDSILFKVLLPDDKIQKFLRIVKICFETEKGTD